MKNISIIKNNHDFQKIIGSKKCLKTRQFYIYFNMNSDNFRYGISVGKKLGIAVLRNKVKRQVRMMIKSFLDEVKEEKIQMIIIVRKTYFDYSFDQCQTWLKKSVLSIVKK
jgi:ribonuclease P protein component